MVPLDSVLILNQIIKILNLQITRAVPKTGTGVHSPTPFMSDFSSALGQS